jgi:hypothetical protein
MYVFKDKLRTTKFYAKDSIKENRNTRFYYPNPACDANMYICGKDLLLLILVPIVKNILIYKNAHLVPQTILSHMNMMKIHLILKVH